MSPLCLFSFYSRKTPEEMVPRPILRVFAAPAIVNLTKKSFALLGNVKGASSHLRFETFYETRYYSRHPGV
jgi:hypothetical protein